MENKNIFLNSVQRVINVLQCVPTNFWTILGTQGMTGSYLNGDTHF